MKLNMLRLDEFCDSVRDGTHDTPQKVDNGYKLITAKHINNTGIDFSEAYFISEKDYNHINERSKVEKWDVLMSMIGNGLGKTYLVSNNPDYAIKNLALFKIGEEYKAKWLHYYLSSSIGQNLIYSKLQGTGQPFVSLSFLRKMKIPVPDSYCILCKITSILSAYDNLIENNNRRIRLLEQMAENLYKEWFVCFRFPGHEKAEFENGMPKGWVVKRMSDFCDVTDGTHDTPKPVDDGVPLITGKCISNGFIDFNEAYSISLEDHDKIKRRSGLSTGDILFSNIGTVGNCCIVDYDREFSVKNVIIFKTNDILKTAYLYYWMMSDSMQNVFSTQTNGASQQFVGLTFMRRYKILVPEQEVLSSFGERINPIIEQKRYLHRINKTLVRQRDLLLPRLMSGKLEVNV